MTGAERFGARPLLVVGLGGNAVSPRSGDQSYVAERDAIAAAALELAEFVPRYRLVLVHGNGPQVGRLLREPADVAALDIHVAQTQGELGFLLAQALERATDEPVVTLLTRTVVAADDPAFAAPVKAVGPLHPDPFQPPADEAWRRAPGGWLRVVASPRPLAIAELAAVSELARARHVVAGGGGGVPVTRAGASVACVVDKDAVAGLLAHQLGAAALLLVTDVDGAFAGFGGPGARLLRDLNVGTAHSLLGKGEFAAGSMGPKVAAAAAFAATGSPAVICRLGAMADALAGRAGTRIHPDPQRGLGGAA